MSLILAGCILALSGCQTFKSTFDSKPGARSLAFWKKGSDSVPPPPPAQHLNPSTTDSFSELANLGDRNGIDIDMDEYNRKIDGLQDSVASAAESTFGKEPLRSPYGSGNSGFGFPKDAPGIGAAKNSIDQKLAAAKEKAQTFGTKPLSDAQNKFNAAIAGVKKPLDANTDFRSPKDILSTRPASEFKNAIAESNSQLKSGLESSLAAAKKNIALDNKLAKVNQSLYDMHGNLTTGGNAASKPVADTIDAARQRFGSAVSTVSDKAIEAAKTTTEFGGGFKDKVVAAASELQPPLRGGDNSFKPAFNKAVAPVANTANKIVESAKQTVAGLGSGPDFPKLQPPKLEIKPSAPANNQFGGGSFAAAAKTAASESFGGNFNRTRVANVTPASSTPSGGTFAKPAESGSGLGSSLTKSWNNGSRQSNLKAIEVGPQTSTPGNVLRTAFIRSDEFNAGTANIPAAFDAGRNAAASHISDVDIPNKVLSGSGSYAPGSVNKVR